MHKELLRVGCLFALVVFGCLAVAAAQERVVIDIDQVGSYLLPLAMPKFIGESADPEVAQAIREVLRQDLELTGLFRILDPGAYANEVPPALNLVSYENWLSIGAVGVVVGRLTKPTEQAKIALELMLHDVAERTALDGRQYNGPRSSHREMAHRFSNHVFRAYTGEEGPFNTQVVCVTPGKGRKRSKDIVMMDYDGHDVRSLITNGALNLAPVLSPDGSALAYTSYRAGSPDLYLRDMRTGQEERLTKGPGLALAGSWSPDGRYLALTRSVEGNSDLLLYDIQEKRFRRLTTHQGIDVSPSFAPDGQRLVFTSDRGGSPQLYLTDVQGRQPTRLTYEGRYNTAPAWAPRGETIAFIGRAQDTSLAVYTIRADGQGLRRLTHEQRQYEAPSWDPNGRFVMYTSTQGGAWQRQITREEGQRKSLPTPGPVCLSPQWVTRTASSS